MYVLHTASHVNPCIARIPHTPIAEQDKQNHSLLQAWRAAEWTLHLSPSLREQNLHPQSAAMPLFTRALGLLRQARSPQVMNKAWSSKRAQTHEISAGEQAIGLGVLFSVFLIPSGWILSHFEDYKKRPE